MVLKTSPSRAFGVYAHRVGNNHTLIGYVFSGIGEPTVVDSIRFQFVPEGFENANGLKSKAIDKYLKDGVKVQYHKYFYSPRTPVLKISDTGLIVTRRSGYYSTTSYRRQSDGMIVPREFCSCYNLRTQRNFYVYGGSKPRSSLETFEFDSNGPGPWGNFTSSTVVGKWAQSIWSDGMQFTDSSGVNQGFGSVDIRTIFPSVESPTQVRASRIVLLYHSFLASVPTWDTDEVINWCFGYKSGDPFEYFSSMPDTITAMGFTLEYSVSSDWVDTEYFDGINSSTSQMSLFKKQVTEWERNIASLNWFGMSHLDDFRLDESALLSFNISNGKLLRELLDTAMVFEDFGLTTSELNRLKSARKLLKQYGSNLSKSEFERVIKYMASKGKLSTTLFPKIDDVFNLTAKDVSTLYLWYKFGVYLPGQTLKTWLSEDSPYRTSNIDRYVFPTILRSGRTVTVPWYDNKNQIEVPHKRAYGLGSESGLNEVEAVAERYGLTLTLSDVWDLLPLSFVIDWVSGIVKDEFNRADASRIAMRFDYPWCCDSASFLTSIETCFGEVPVHVYYRVYSGRKPTAGEFWNLSWSEENWNGYFSCGSSLDASALILAFLG